MSQITQWLHAASRGDGTALGRVFESLYPELRRIARARLDAGERTLTPTVLVHEVFLRLIGNQQLALNDRRHFLACAARAMRAVVIDNARRRSAGKRGGPEADLALDALPFEVSGVASGEHLLALDESLVRLDEINPRQREVVELRYFAGLDFAEISALLGCSERTAKREWERARAFLHAHMAD
ncbi:MAG: sigma-70 family RNA polymerase sigma factor [Xanthomonadales bacterium]|nr:sigma-70 family RNA polymerase sigma factor [Xanthomonadales bacterium]MCC6561118.1 sigma-70 family RNA polymerase sigma factor [Xanthomonadales bacterium]